MGPGITRQGEADDRRQRLSIKLRKAHDHVAHTGPDDAQAAGLRCRRIAVTGNDSA
jgi:hypothetical protein